MEIYERIRMLRKIHLSMTQDAFGAKLGVNRDVIANIERNRLVRPEQKEPLYRLICSTFNVSYEWLTTGEGEMKVETKEDALTRFSEQYGLPDYAKQMLSTLMKLDEHDQIATLRMMEALAKSYKEEEAAAHNKGSIASGGASTPLHVPGHVSDALLSPEADTEFEAEADALAAKVRAEFLREKRTEQEASSFTNLKNMGTGAG